LAVIIANNVAGAPPGMAGVDPTIVIPTVSTRWRDANAIKGATRRRGDLDPGR